jgi:hypothetical protein
MHKLLVTLAAMVLLSVSAFADKKDAFKKAASVNGPSCDLIPYDDLNDGCREAYKEQTVWCTGEKELGCPGLKKDDPKDREIAKERRDNATQCIKDRNYTADKFASAVSRLESENETDPEMRGYIDTLKGKIRTSIQNHANTIEQVENRQRKCDNIYNGRD